MIGRLIRGIKRRIIKEKELDECLVTIFESKYPQLWKEYYENLGYTSDIIFKNGKFYVVVYKDISTEKAKKFRKKLMELV